MSRRRSPLMRTRKSAHRFHEIIERLEERRLLTTVITDTDPLTPTPATFTFEYKDAEDVPVRVVVHGDVSAEFVFARVTKGNKETGEIGNEVILGDHVLASNEEEDGRDLFHVYIAQASIDSYIAIAEFNDSETGPRPMTPFEGSVTLRIQPAFSDIETVTTPGGTGAIYLGARTRDIEFPDVEDVDNVPIRSDNFNGQGIAPAPANGRLVAGVMTAPGVSIGKFMFAGVVSGQVTFQGSVETFYAGSLLTGVTEGQFAGTPLGPNNFYVAGDIRNILVKGSIGTHELGDDEDTRATPTYFTGTDFDIKGRVGQIKAGLDYAGFGTIYNDLPNLGLRTRQQEIEVRVPDNVGRFSFTEFQNGQFGDREAFFHNDTFETAQFLGSINSKQLGNDSIQLNGLYQWLPRTQDAGDFYAVSLMAGQKVTVRLLAPIVLAGPTLVNGQLVTEIPSSLHAGVFDPERRLIASDWSNVSATTTQPVDADPAKQQLFSFTADRPGIYYIAVGRDPTFANPGLRLGLEQPYQLQLTGVGNMGLGGLSAGSTILATSATDVSSDAISGILANIEVVRGDLGAIYTPDFIVGNGGVTGIADGGNFRALDALSLGQLNTETNAFGDGVDILALTGSVGMVRSSGTGDNNYTLFQTVDSLLFPIGGDIQWVVSQNNLTTQMQANGSIGVIQAQQIGAANFAGSISVNVDGVGKPGTIDLIDVGENLGTLTAGGPVISTNVGGNVRYIRLSEGGTAFRPVLFGGSLPEETTYVQGQQAQITDDSGAQVLLTPTEQRATDPTTGAVIDRSGTLTLLTYPIARSQTNTGAGGSVIIRVTSTRGVGVSTSRGGSVEIGEIVSTGTANNLIPSPGADGIPNTADDNVGPDRVRGTGDDPFIEDRRTRNDNSIDLSGGLIDVFSIRGNNFNYIRNNTPGEIVNADIGQIPLLLAENLGIARSRAVSGLAVEGNNVADISGTSEVEGTTFPFNNTKNAIVIRAGSAADPAAIDILARQAIGNVMVLGTVQQISANHDNAGVRGVHEGINGAIYVKGQLRLVRIGEGLLPSGTGSFAHAGIYASSDGTAAHIGRIEHVVNQGEGSDIRGDIVSNRGIGIVELTNGSIINADIMVIAAETVVNTGADLALSSEFGGVGTIFEDGIIELITVQGTGGIIGLNATSADLGPVTSTGGFGIINSEFTVPGNGRFAPVTAGGYGARGVTWNGGQSIDGITVLGNGKRLNTTSFAPGVRLSELVPVDPFFGTKPNPLTDLHVVIGTTAAAPQRKGTSASGSLDLSAVRVSRDIGFIRANTIRAVELSLGNNIGTIETTDYVDSLIITAGRIGTFAVGKDALRTDVGVSGPVDNVYIGGAFRGTSQFFASGSNGSIGNFITGTTLYGNVYAEREIGSIRVGTHYGSQGTRSGGNIGQFITNGDVSADSVLSAKKNLGRLVIGRNFVDSAIIKLGSLGTKTVIGDDAGEIVFT